MLLFFGLAWAQTVDPTVVGPADLPAVPTAEVTGAAPAVPEPAAVPEAAAALGPGRVHLELRNPGARTNVVTETRVGFEISRSTRQLCVGACVVELPAGLVQLELGGPGLLKVERRFMLPEGGDLHVRGHLGSGVGMGLGAGFAGLAFVGWVSMPVWITALVVDAIDEEARTDPLNAVLRGAALGYGLVIGGVTVGGVLVVASLPRVRVEPGAPSAQVQGWVAPGSAGISATF